MSWLPKHCVVVPVDFSEQSIRAVDLALGLVEDPSNVHVVHVLAPLTSMGPGVAWTSIDDEVRRQDTEAALKQRFGGPVYAKVQFHLVIDDPGQGIAEYAEKLGADLIVMPSHGRTGIQRLLIGSVAERVIRLAHCPVLVLRA